MSIDVTRTIDIDYTNWRGVRATRSILPLHIYFGSTEYHTEPQWILKAVDVAKNEERHFAMKDIHSFDLIQQAVCHGIYRR